MWKSAEFVDVEPLTPVTTCCRAAPPVEVQRPTLLAEKSMSYAKLYQVLAVSCVLHCVTPPTIHLRVLSLVPLAPERRPYLSSVKWL
jgi:hypothetical protein